MTEAIRREDWYQPPEGILEGSPFEIAQGFIDRQRADDEYMTHHPLSEDPEHISRSEKARLEMSALLDEYQERLDQGDERLARLLARRVECEVEKLNRGERSTVTGQAHLMAERLANVGHIWAVVIQDNPTE